MYAIAARRPWATHLLCDGWRNGSLRVSVQPRDRQLASRPPVCKRHGFRLERLAHTRIPRLQATPPQLSRRWLTYAPRDNTLSSSPTSVNEANNPMGWLRGDVQVLDDEVSASATQSWAMSAGRKSLLEFDGAAETEDDGDDTIETSATMRVSFSRRADNCGTQPIGASVNAL